MLEHSRFHGSLSLFAIISSSRCRVQADANNTYLYLSNLLGKYCYLYLRKHLSAYVYFYSSI